MIAPACVVEDVSAAELVSRVCRAAFDSGCASCGEDIPFDAETSSHQGVTLGQINQMREPESLAPEAVRFVLVALCNDCADALRESHFSQVLARQSTPYEDRAEVSA